eukprot:TRINITY_DN989_c0_g1_i14.p1 TRINITY_DN989_c0_g1~~TRINITY_DN989_c0_g1_i14.p1  ORF type:complete len:295 (+),score=86.13 TRINITY_DN989_c0_g1_i14:1-885(+)
MAERLLVAAGALGCRAAPAKGSGELLLYVRSESETVPVTVDADATVGALLDAVAAALRSKRPVALLYQGRRLAEGDRDLPLADSGLSQEAAVDVDAPRMLECIAFNAERLVVCRGDEVKGKWPRKATADTAVVKRIADDGNAQAYFGPPVSTRSRTVWAVAANKSVAGGCYAIGIIAEDVPRIGAATNVDTLDRDVQRLLGNDRHDFYHWRGQGKFWLLDDYGALVGPGFDETLHTVGYGHPTSHVTMTLDSGVLTYSNEEGASLSTVVPSEVESVLFFVSVFNESAMMHVRML